jgi:hypothetical protein
MRKRGEASHRAPSSFRAATGAVQIADLLPPVPRMPSDARSDADIRDERPGRPDIPSLHAAFAELQMTDRAGVTLDAACTGRAN